METPQPVITKSALLDHWQGRRALTRRVIEAFPEDQLFTFSIGGMRPFAELAYEFLRLSAPGLRGVVTGDWSETPERPTTKAELLRRWDAATAEINALWAQMPESRFRETVKAWGQWEGPASETSSTGSTTRSTTPDRATSICGRLGLLRRDSGSAGEASSAALA